MDAQVMSVKSANKQKSGTWVFMLSMVIGAAIGGVVGWPIGRFMKSHGNPHLSGWTLALIPVELILVLGLHEFGHVVGGLVSGLQFRLLVVGPLRIERVDGKLKVSFNRIPMLWGGIAGCLPKSYGDDLRRKMLLFIAGGPLFSFAGSALLMPGFAMFRAQPDVGFLMIAFGILSAVIGVVTLLPLPMAGFKTDGSRLWMLWRRRPEGTRWTALGAIGGLAQSTRPREWPEALMALLGESRDYAGDAVQACLMRHVWHMDRKEWEAAKMWLERGLQNVGAMPKAAQPIVFLAAANYYARQGADAGLARDYFSMAQKPGIHDPNDSHAVRAAVLIAEGCKAEARVELDFAEEKLRSKPESMARWMREEIDELRALIN